MLDGGNLAPQIKEDRMPAQTAARLETLTVEECLRLLESQAVGRLGFVDDGRPQVLPVNYRFHEGAVVFRTTHGRLLDAIHLSAAAFEIDEIDNARHTGWSVVVHGRAEEVSRAEELPAFRGLPLTSWAPGDRDHYVQILPRTITGRRITAGLDEPAVLWLG